MYTIGGICLKSENVIEEAIDELRNEFLEDEDEFFNEHDFHHIFFCKLYPQFKHLIHPEYPTRNRFIRNKGNFEEYLFGEHCFQPGETNKGVRGHYDFVIFNREYYTKFKNELDSFERLSNKLVTTNLDIIDKYIDFAFEFKYVTSGSKSIIDEVEFDIFKLKEAYEVEIKYLIIFIKKIRFSEKGFNQIIGPITKFAESEKDIKTIIIY